MYTNCSKMFAGELPILEGESLASIMGTLGLGAMMAAIGGIILANTDFFITKPDVANLEYLENAELKNIAGGKMMRFIFITVYFKLYKCINFTILSILFAFR